MHLDGQQILCGIIQLKESRGILHRLVDIGRRPLYHEHAVIVLSSYSTDGINKHLFVGQQVVDGRCFGAVLRIGLVKSREDQSLVVVFERLCYLRPDGLQHLFVLRHLSLIRISDVLLEPATVPMVVEHHIEVGLDAIVHHFLHSGHPVLVDRVLGGVADMSQHPRTRDAHRPESLRLHKFNQFGCGFRPLPAGFCIETGLVVEQGSLTR